MHFHASFLRGCRGRRRRCCIRGGAARRLVQIIVVGLHFLLGYDGHQATSVLCSEVENDMN